EGRAVCLEEERVRVLHLQRERTRRFLALPPGVDVPFPLEERDVPRPFNDPDRMLHNGTSREEERSQEKELLHRRFCSRLFSLSSRTFFLSAFGSRPMDFRRESIALSRSP